MNANEIENPIDFQVYDKKVQDPDNNKSLWVPDNKVNICYKCFEKFNPIFLRKHHCRICGNIFCHQCSSYSINGSYWGIKKQVKVCFHCYNTFLKLDKKLVETTVLEKEILEMESTSILRRTKLENYCLQYKREKEVEAALKNETKLDNERRIEGIYYKLVKYIIKTTLENKLINEKWYDFIINSVINTINEVQPSFKYLNDSLDITEYIKIVTLKYHNYSKTQIINGFALKKNVLSKKMSNKIDNPQILLLSSGLDFDREINSYVDLNIRFNQEDAHIDILLKKIEQSECNIIIVAKTISRKIQEKLKNKISLVMLVKENILKRIARLTKTYILPGTDLIDKQVILGCCSQFRVEKIKKIDEEDEKSNENKNIIANEIPLMIFDGCNPLLGRAIILSGPDESELEMIKEVMKDLLITVRDMYLHKKLMKHFQSYIPDINQNILNKEFESLIELQKIYLSTKDEFEILIRLANFMICYDNQSNSKDNSLMLDIQKENILSLFNYCNKYFCFDIHFFLKKQYEKEIIYTDQSNSDSNSEFNMRMSLKTNQIESPKKIESKLFSCEDQTLNLDNISIKDSKNLFLDIRNSKASKNMEENKNVKEREVSKVSKEGIESKSKSKNSLEGKVFENKSISQISYIFYSLVKILLRIQVNSIFSSLNYFYGIDYYSLIDMKNQKNNKFYNLIKVTYTYQSNSISGEEKNNESEVLKKIYSYCEEPGIINFSFYSTMTINDLPFGKFLIDMILEKDQKCETCKKVKSNHIYYIMNKTGRIKLTILANDLLKFFINQEEIEYHTILLNNIKNKTDNLKKINETENLFEDNNKYNINIYYYSYCNKCLRETQSLSGSIVNFFSQIPSELYNFSLGKYIKLLLNEISCMNNPYLENKSNCSHSISKDITKVFLTQYGSIKFQYETNPIYIIEPSPVSLISNYVPFNITSNQNGTFFKSDEVYSLFEKKYKEILLNQIIETKTMSLEALVFLKNYSNIIHDKYIILFSSFDFEGGEKEMKIKNYISNNLIGQSLKYIKITNDLMKLIEILCDSSKFDEDLMKFLVFKQKIYMKITQIRFILTVLARTLIRILKTIEYLKNEYLYNNLYLQKTNETQSNQKENTMISNTSNLNNKLSLIKIISHDQYSGSLKIHKEEDNPEIVGNENCVKKVSTVNIESSTIINTGENLPIKNSLSKRISFYDKENYVFLISEINYYDIESKTNVTLNKILNKIQYIDENHKVLTSEIENTDNDLSSLISYALTSDKYKAHLHQQDKFKLYLISTNKKLVTLNTGTLTQPQPQVNFENDVNEDEIHDTNLIFNIKNNTYKMPSGYTYDTQKINQQLDTELLSDDKQHFVITLSNKNFFFYLKEWNLEFDSQKVVVSNDTSLKENKDNKEIKGYVVDCVGKTISDLDLFKSLLSSIRRETNLKDEVKNMINYKYKQNSIDFINDESIMPIDYEITIYYPRQFEALRIAYCDSYENFIKSLFKSNIISTSGGKTKARFLTSIDGKYIMKLVEKFEFRMFIDSGFQYFHHCAKYLFHNMPSALAKILGAYKIKKKYLTMDEQTDYYYMILMENISYGKDSDIQYENKVLGGVFNKKEGSIQRYDLKGSKLNRYIDQSKRKKDEVLLDTNFKEDFNGNPIIFDMMIYKLLMAAIINDSLLLSKMNIMDYSLFIMIEDITEGEINAKSIRLGIIDYVRKYTWDKQLEKFGKKMIYRENPTIDNPINYRQRFREAMSTYFIGV